MNRRTLRRLCLERYVSRFVHNKLTYYLFFGLLFLLCPFTVQAGDVVINEFSTDASPQWVELYNKGNSSVSISGWIIDDSGGIENFPIPEGTAIDPQAWRVFESNDFHLNSSSSDTIKLLNGSTVEDSFSYILGPEANNSYGRDIDGTGNWHTFNLPTKGEANIGSTPLPTPTVTPTLTPTQGATPTLTKTPTPTRTPTPQPSLTPTKFPTTQPAGGPTNSVSKQQVLGATKKQSQPTPILAIENESVSPTKIVEKTVAVKGSSTSRLPTILIAAGSISILVCGILLYLRWERVKQFP